MAEINETIFAEHKVELNKAVPYHIQVYQALDRIISSKLKAGDQLPGEPRLCELFGVSRTVIRQALDQLLRDGSIIRIMGKGTFVAEPKINEGLISRLTGFYEDMVEQGYTPVSKVLQQEVLGATAKIARNLNLNIGDEVIVIKRLRYVNDTPILLVTTYIPKQLCPELLDVDLSHKSLYAFLLENCQIKIERGKRLIEAVLANEEEAQLLKIRQGAPLILIDSVSYLKDGTALEYYHAVHRSDRARFEVELLRMDT